MNEEGQILANWAQLAEFNIKVVMDVRNYNPFHEERILIPYIENGKFGLINKDCEIVLEAKYDCIKGECFSEDDILILGTIFPYGFDNGRRIDARYRYKYRAINSQGEFITKNEYDFIDVSEEKNLLTVQDRDKGYGVIDLNENEIIAFGSYNWIDGFDKGLSRVNNGLGKWGIINETGEVVLPLEYSKIWNFKGKHRSSTRAEKGGVYEEIYFVDLQKDDLPF